MARRRRRQKKKGSGALAWMSVGLVIGLGLSAGVYVLFRGVDWPSLPERPAARTADGRSPASTGESTEASAAASAEDTAGPATAATSAAAGPTAAAASQAGATTGAQEPDDEADRFDFYDVLQSYEVVVPEIETAEPRRSRTADVAEPGVYVLQAGSFLSAADAESQKARLALLGIESRIQVVTVDQYVYHRVRVGPVDDLQQINRYRRQLIDAGVETMTIRLNDRD